MLLNFVFWVHGGLALGGAFLLVAAPGWFTQIITGVPWAASPMREVAASYAIIAAFGGILVGLVSGFARNASRTATRYAALRELLWLSLAALALSVLIFLKFPVLGLLLVAFNFVFAFLYWYIEQFAKSEI